MDSVLMLSVELYREAMARRNRVVSIGVLQAGGFVSAENTKLLCGIKQKFLFKEQAMRLPISYI